MVHELSRHKQTDKQTIFKIAELNLKPHFVRSANKYRDEIQWL